MASSKLRYGSSRDEYKSWKEVMVLMLESKMLGGFIDGTLPLPPETNSQAHKDWKRTDRIVKEWIIAALDDRFLPAVVARKTARDVWLHLETIFTPSTSSSSSPPPPLLGVAMPLALYKAALRGEWEATRDILDKDPELAKARVAPISDTVLHIAVSTGKAIPYLQNLINALPDDAVALKNTHGRTALHAAAIKGNLAAAELLVQRLPSLLYEPDIWGVFPIVVAAMSAHRPTVNFFLSQTRDDLDTNPYAADDGVLILDTLIHSYFFDISLDFVRKYPDLAKRQHRSGHSALRTLSLTDDAFASGARFNFWERLIYSSIQLKIEPEPPNAADIESPSCCTLIPRKFGRWHRFLKVIRRIVPQPKWIHEEKVKHEQALELVTCVCKNMESLSEAEAASIYGGAMLKAAELGIPEVIEAIVETFPLAIYAAQADTRSSFFHIAVQNRCEKVFNLIYQMSNYKYEISNIKDHSGDTLLHLVAKLAPPHKLNLVSGAALQMQRELQWFKEVEKHTHRPDRKRPNNDGITPKMIFTEEHSNLKAEGERWMKDTANSCSIAAALIATVVFAAAITVPGGNAESGFPLFARSSAFIMFAVSDAVSLFTSTTSLLMFLAILTSRYAEEDFLHALPKRLCVGLFTLFISILSMMAAFSCAIYLVFGKMSGWVLIPVAVLACLPVTSFVLLQFPLLVDVVSSTYGRGIFGRQSDRPFH